MSVTVEQCRNKDLLAELNMDVQALHARLFPNLFKPYDKSEVAGFFDWTLQQTDWLHFVAYREEQAVAMIVAERRRFINNPFRKDAVVLYIHQISVKADVQRKGIGKKLIESIRALTVKEGIKRIELDVWSENSRAKAFFGNQGFDSCRQSMCVDLSKESIPPR